MASNESEIDSISLRGWFIKEKRDSFKRSKSFLPGASSSNRRWFTIERIPSSNGSGEELALCYYKRSTSEKEDRCGWLFLNDCLSLSQDIPDRWIIIEHPTRILRLCSPTPAQHRVWFSTLSKCCKNLRKEVASPSSASEPTSGERRPSLPYFDDTVRQRKRNSLKNAAEAAPATPKDELQFLRGLSGRGSEESKETRRSLFNDAASSPVEGQLKGKKVASRSNDTTRRNTFSKEGAAIRTTSGADLGARLNSAITGNSVPPHMEEEKAEVEPLSYVGRGFEESNVRSGSFRNNPGATDRFDMNALKTALYEREDQGLNCKELHPSNSFSSSRQISRSSSYRLHFGDDDDDDVSPDDNFLDDWDG